MQWGAHFSSCFRRGPAACWVNDFSLKNIHHGLNMKHKHAGQIFTVMSSRLEAIFHVWTRCFMPMMVYLKSMIIQTKVRFRLCCNSLEDFFPPILVLKNLTCVLSVWNCQYIWPCKLTFNRKSNLCLVVVPLKKKKTCNLVLTLCCNPAE